MDPPNKMEENQNPVENPEGTTEPTENEPTPAPSGEENSQEEVFQMPDKFRDKKPEEIAKSYLELEKKLGDHDDFKRKAELFDQVSPFLESLREPEPDRPDPSKFQSVEELNEYWEGKLSGIEKAMETKFGARLEAERKLNQLTSEYPEMKDRQFRGFVISAMQSNPGRDVFEIAKEIKGYLETVQTKGREAAKKELLEKGGFQGKSEGNKPMRSQEDNELVNSIVNAGKDEEGESGVFS